MALKEGKYYFKGLEMEVTSSTTLQEIKWVFSICPELEEVINLDYDNSTEVDNDSNSKTKPRNSNKRSSRSKLPESE
jgi:hypothetical protein